MNTSSQQHHFHNQYYTWPDPRGKWPESAKKTLKDLLIRGKSNQTPSSQPPQNITSMMKEEPNSQQQQQQNPLAGVGLTSGLSDYNFSSSSSSSSSSSKGVASVAAFLTYAAHKMISASSSSSSSSSSQQTVEKDLHECTLMFIADLLEVACGPAGPACVKVKFPSDDPTGTNFYKQFSEKNGVRVTTVENFRAAGNLMSSVEQIEANNNNNNSNNLQNSATKKKNAVQMTVSSSICLVKNPNNNNNNNNSFVVVDRWGAEAQQQAIHYYNQHQNLVQTTTGAAQRRGRQSAVNSTYNNQQDGGASTDEDIRNPTSVLFGFFATTVACSSCPFDGLRALLCRRPALHQLPCSVLLIFFASLPKILKQYDFVRGQPAGLDNSSSNPMTNNTSANNNNSNSKRGPPRISEILPMGLPFPMQLFDGEDHNSEGLAQWEWLWSRVTVLNRLLSEGSESYARVM